VNVLLQARKPRATKGKALVALRSRRDLHLKEREMLSRQGRERTSKTSVPSNVPKKKRRSLNEGGDGLNAPCLSGGSCSLQEPKKRGVSTTAVESKFEGLQKTAAFKLVDPLGFDKRQNERTSFWGGRKKTSTYAGTVLYKKPKRGEPHRDKGSAREKIVTPLVEENAILRTERKIKRKRETHRSKKKKENLKRLVLPFPGKKNAATRRHCAQHQTGHEARDSFSRRKGRDEAKCLGA